MCGENDLGLTNCSDDIDSRNRNNPPKGGCSTVSVAAPSVEHPALAGLFQTLHRGLFLSPGFFYVEIEHRPQLRADDVAGECRDQPQPAVQAA